MRLVAYAVAVVVLGLVAPSAAFAHDDVVGTSPSNGDQVTQAPGAVRVEFAERPTSGFGSITGPGGQDLSRGKARIDGAELVIPMRPESEPGPYTVEFRVISTDGHPTTGDLSFELIQQSPPTPTSAATSPGETGANPAPDPDSPAAEGEGSSAWLWAGVAGGVGVAVAALLIASALSRARSGP